VPGPNLKLYTWGCAGRTQAELFDLMTKHHIALVVDVRQRPRSRDARWGKRELAATFGTNYRHLPQLGNKTRRERSGPSGRALVCPPARADHVFGARSIPVSSLLRGAENGGADRGVGDRPSLMAVTGEKGAPWTREPRRWGEG
jgi:hypothetical protein